MTNIPENNEVQRWIQETLTTEPSYEQFNEAVFAYFKDTDLHIVVKLLSDIQSQTPHRYLETFLQTLTAVLEDDEEARKINARVVELWRRGEYSDSIVDILVSEYEGMMPSLAQNIVERIMFEGQPLEILTELVNTYGSNISLIMSQTRILRAFDRIPEEIIEKQIFRLLDAAKKADRNRN